MFEDESNSMPYTMCSVEPEMLRCRRSLRSSSGGPRRGSANAARVSRGTEHDVWPGLSVKEPKRHSDEHVTVTIVIYNTIADGIPSEEDVLAAIDDLEALYEACTKSGRLADSTFDFMKEELTVKQATEIATKIVTQPYQPPSQGVQNFTAFPQ